MSPPAGGAVLSQRVARTETKEMEAPARRRRPEAGTTEGSLVELTIGVRDLRRLVTPVIPCAGTDDMLPVLTAVCVESRGKHLVAIATDRFRLAIQRVAAPVDETWPEFKALIPASTLKSILATFKPSYRDADPVLTLTVDGTTLRAVAEGALLDLFDEAHLTYRLMDGEFPKVRSLIRSALAAEPGHASGFNPKLIAGVLPATQGTVAVKIGGGVRDPLVFTDGEDFVAILMPRRLIGQGNEQPIEFPALSDWTDLLADEPKASDKKPARKRASAKQPEAVSA